MQKFQRTKILKQRVRNYIEPEKKLGHSDTPANKVKNSDDHDDHDEPEVQQKGTAEVCEDCK